MAVGACWCGAWSVAWLTAPPSPTPRGTSPRGLVTGQPPLSGEKSDDLGQEIGAARHFAALMGGAILAAAVALVPAQPAGAAIPEPSRKFQDNMGESGVPEEIRSRPAMQALVAKSKELEPLNRQRMFLKIAQKTMNAALTDPFSAHFFVRRASDPQYVDYIGKKGFEELSDSDRLIKDEKLTDLTRELEVFQYKSKDAETWANKFVDIDDYTKFPDYLLKTVRYGPVSDKNPLKPEFKAEQEAAMKSPERRDPSVGAGG